MLLSSCVKDENVDSKNDSSPASLKITIAGEPTKTRGKGEPTLEQENNVFNYTVYVVNASNNKVQAVRTFTNSGLTNTVTGLTTGAKIVFVVANSTGTSIPVLAVGDDISGINTPALLLDEQEANDVTTTGLVMSGQANITLIAGDNVMPFPLEVRRVVGKVRLGSVTFDPEVGQDGTFVLQNVLIMRARSEASFGATTIYTGTGFYGGVTGTVSVQRDFLAEAISLTDYSDRFFYVFPNDNTDDNSTLLTLQGTFDGNTVYFPIRINDLSGIGGSTSDGSYIKRNMIYTLNVTIKRPGNGSPDPETPVDPATLQITVGVVDWEGDLIQNVEV